MTNLNSAAMANILAIPQVLNTRDECEEGTSKEYLNVATSNLNLNDIWYVGVVPWDAVIHSINFTNAAKLDSNVSPTLTLDVGVYALRLDGTIASIAPQAYVAAGTFGQVINSLPGGFEAAFVARTYDLVGQTVATDAGFTSGNPVINADGNRGSKAIIGIKVHAAPATAQASKCFVQVSWSI